MAKKEQKKLTANERSIGKAMEALASKYAAIVAPFAMPTIDLLNKARQEWEGGAFQVMYKITSQLEPEQLAELPDPRVGDGNNPGHYFTAVIRDGKEKVEEHDFYEVMVEGFPGIIARRTRIDQLQRSMKDPSKVNTSDIGHDILGAPDGKGGRTGGMSIDYRNSEINRLTKEISGAVGKVKNAFGLFFQLQSFSSLKHVEVYVIHKLGPDNLPLNGANGRGYEVDPTTTPIILRSTVAGREDVDKVRVAISTFLKYDVEKAKENGGTYQAVLDTVKREKKGDKTGNEGNTAMPQLIRTPDTFIARLVDQHEFAEFAWDQKDDKLIDGIRKALTGAGSDNAFTSAMALKRFLNEVCPDSPRNTQRYQELIGKDDAAAA